MIVRHIAPAVAIIIVTVLLVAACRSTAGFPSRAIDTELGPAWAAWKAGDFVRAEGEAQRLLVEPQSADPGHLMLALTRHVAGDHPAAIWHYERIGSAYRWRGILIEPMVWSYIAAGEHERAIEHAVRHRLGRVAVERIRLAAEQPMSVAIEGVAELVFTPDELSPYMPGVEGVLNGHPIVARLDTGGSYLHLSEEAAQRFGIQTIGCDTGFASLSRTRICYGVADLTLGPVTMTGVPVSVHAQGLSADPLAEHFDARMDAIIGTSILERFLATIDGPGRRILLSARGDAAAGREHRLVVGGGVEVPFGVWTSHLMVAPGEVAGRGAMNLFVDSGLVMITPEQGQASVLMSRRTLDELGVKAPDHRPFIPLQRESGLSGALREALLAYPVDERTWAGFGDWGGIDVRALIGWGYFKQFVWTIDFDRRVYVLGS